MPVVKLWCCQDSAAGTLLFTQVSIYRSYFAGGIMFSDAQESYLSAFFHLQARATIPCSLLGKWPVLRLFTLNLRCCLARFCDARSFLSFRVDRFLAAYSLFTFSVICFCSSFIRLAFDFSSMLWQGVFIQLYTFLHTSCFRPGRLVPLRSIPVFELGICACIVLVLVPCIGLAATPKVSFLRHSTGRSTGNRLCGLPHHFAPRGAFDRFLERVNG